ncbi:MAG: Respiratory supercomplex factor 1, mitochondrial [Alyxoria varia]|nr:MAG: Respiratory supercomplex factor 1, mitochondrial [Alyxoria varia]
MPRAEMPDTVKGDAPMPSSFDGDLEFWDERRLHKLTRRLREEPLIPLGLGLTVYALYGASRSIRAGNKTQTNMYFRARVYAQAFTLLCLCVGSVYWKGDREKRKYYQGLLSEKRAQEKRDAWIRELEVRDEEDSKERERRQERRRVRREMEGKEGVQVEGSEAQSPMRDEDWMRLVGGGRILGSAMLLWNRRKMRDQEAVSGGSEDEE